MLCLQTRERNSPEVSLLYALKRVRHPVMCTRKELSSNHPFGRLPPLQPHQISTAMQRNPPRRSLRLIRPPHIRCRRKSRNATNRLIHVPNPSLTTIFDRTRIYDRCSRRRIRYDNDHDLQKPPTPLFNFLRMELPGLTSRPHSKA